MRTHNQIIKDAGGPATVQLFFRDVPIATIRGWVQRRSIPSEYWMAFDTLGWASLTELAAAVAKSPVSA